MACAIGGDEKRAVLCVGVQKAFDEFAADFIGVLAD